MGGAGVSDLRGEVALEVHGRSACSRGEVRPTTAAIAMRAGRPRTGTLTTEPHLWDRWWPLAGRKLDHRLAGRRAAGGHDDEGVAVTSGAS